MSLWKELVMRMLAAEVILGRNLEGRPDVRSSVSFLDGELRDMHRL